MNPKDPVASIPAPLPPAQLTMSEQVARLDKKITEQHAYIRQNVQVFMAWYISFVTINYGTMGWLAGSRDEKHSLILIVCIIFAIQSLLAIPCDVNGTQYA